MARRRRRYRVEELGLEFGLTNDEVLRDLDPGWRPWRREPGGA